MKLQFLAVAVYALCCCGQRSSAFVDEQYTSGAQHIPGKVYCAYYDTGGEGVAYHDVDPVNHGSGELNPVDGSYLHSFRVDEGVDTSYTKSKDETDISEYNFVRPPLELLYVGWTEPGEWTRYSVVVDEDGVYDVGLLYTSNQGGAVSLDVDGAAALSDAAVPSTFNAADPIDWRQWHHWNETLLGSVTLTKGKHTLTLHTSAVGQMNYAWLDFTSKR